MDALDSAIVAALQSDGRRSNRDLAQMLGVAPSTTLERVRALRTRGVITGIHASTAMAKMGRPVKGMVTVRLRPQSREIVQGFRDFVIGLPETLQVFVTTGAEDLLVLVAVESTRTLRRPGLADETTRSRRVRTEVVFDHLQNPSSRLRDSLHDDCRSVATPTATARPLQLALLATEVADSCQ